ncbi:MAG: glycosyltransferase family 4 protein [Elusimicrobia bacterium]|nr:glycosyltransferase family 4 protein [Elusimicrobiota bacterium]
MSPRIAIVSRWAHGVTGTTTTLLEHARRLAAGGWEVHLYSEKADAGRFSAAGAQTHVVPRLPFGGFLKRRAFAWQVGRELEAEGFDVVFGHGDGLRQDILSLHNCVHAAAEAVHGRGPGLFAGVALLHARQLRGRLFRRLIANSGLTKLDVVRRFGVPEGLVSVIHPGYDPVRFNRAGRDALRTAVRERAGVRPGELLVGLITSGDFAKRGVAPFLQSLGRLPAGIKDRARILVVGAESRLGPYRRLAAESGFAGRAVFLPPEKEVERFFHALDLYVHPALFEEFGQSVQEAMACGVPVLTSRRVGAAELFGPEASGEVLETPAPDALAAALTGLLESPDRRARLAEAGLKACAGNTWDRNFERTYAVIEAVRPGPARPG